MDEGGVLIGSQERLPSLSCEPKLGSRMRMRMLLLFREDDAPGSGGWEARVEELQRL